MLPKFELYRPTTVEQAAEWLTANRGRFVKVLAGGTDLLVDIRDSVIPVGHRPPLSRQPEGEWQARARKIEKPEALCALWKLPDLKGIRQVMGFVSIGSMTTITELERSPFVRAHLSALSDGARQLGSALVRNRGTFGGNLCNARPAADTAVPVLALGARLALFSTRGVREIAEEDFVLGPGRTVIEPDEIVTEIVFDLQDWGEEGRLGSAYIKLAQRQSLEISAVGAAAAISLDAKGVVARARIALGAVAPTPVLSQRAAEILTGKAPSESVIAEAALVASEDCSPITDHRAGKEYRKRMVEVLVRRALNISVARANGEVL